MNVAQLLERFYKEVPREQIEKIRFSGGVLTDKNATKTLREIGVSSHTIFVVTQKLQGGEIIMMLIKTMKDGRIFVNYF